MNDYTKIMAQKSNEELISIIEIQFDGYEKEALEAAKAELESRNISSQDYETSNAIVRDQNLNHQSIENSLAPTLTRFINNIIDSIVVLALIFIVSFLIGFLFPYALTNSPTLAGYSITFAVYISYYTFMENRFQKSLGKMVTKTTVMRMDGETFKLKDAFSRSVCRFLPFDALTFLFSKRGLHDTLSKTCVVQD